MKHLKKYNESLRDKMTPVEGEEMRKLIGNDDVYENVYKILVEKSKLFKPPFETEISFASWSYDYISLYVKINEVRYIYRIEEGKWKTFYSYGRDNESRPVYFDTWEEAYKNMKVVLEKHFNMNLGTERRNLGHIENRIEKLEYTIKEIEKL